MMNGKYYFYDSHSHRPDGMAHSNGRSLLALFDTRDSLVIFLYTYLKSTNAPLTTSVEIQPLTFIPIKRVQIDTSDRLQNYFDSQLSMEMKKQVTNKQNATRKSYMKEYMQKKEDRSDKEVNIEL